MKKWIVPAVMIGTAVIVSLLSYSRMPEQVPIHWDINGNVDNYASKPFALFGIPGLMLLIMLMDRLLPAIEPKRTNMKKNRKDITRIHAVTMLALLIVHVFTIVYGLGYEFNMSTVAPVLVGALFVIVGNVMPRFKPNYTAGIRTPWTLANEQVWRRTQRMSGKVFFFGGMAMMLSTLLPDGIRHIVTIAVILIIVLIPLLGSYLLFRKYNRTNA